MDFESLKLFLAVAEHASFTRAAIELGMTQPTISKRIQQLETQLGSLLLYRHGRGVRLTEAGVRRGRPFGVAPARFDNNLLPAIPAFMFRETRPIGFYGVGKDRTYLDGFCVARSSLPADEPA